jgi:AcrR family transcriptional regulator
MFVIGAIAFPEGMGRQNIHIRGHMPVWAGDTPASGKARPFRIAERAQINKERLYKYFGDKQALFETVLADELDPAHVVFLLIALAAWWSSVPQVAHMLTGADADDPTERAGRRATVVAAARRLASPADDLPVQRRLPRRGAPEPLCT